MKENRKDSERYCAVSSPVKSSAVGFSPAAFCVVSLSTGDRFPATESEPGAAGRTRSQWCLLESVTQENELIGRIVV